MTLGDIAEDR